MSLFDVIKYPDIDIESKEDLSQLPEEVINKWLSRVVEHACQSAESVADKDKTGKCQDVIDKIRAYMRKEIDWDEVEKAYNTAHDATNAAYYANETAYYAAHNAANYAAHDATNAAYYANETAYYAAHNAANYAARNAVYAVNYAANYANETDNSVTLRMYQNWLMEELLAYDMQEAISGV
jgi:hypothetical protein